MKEQEKPITRMAYQHFKGGIYVILGFAEDEKTKEELVIYSRLSDAKVFARPLKDFFAEHPKLGVPRFRLVIPKDA